MLFGIDYARQAIWERRQRQIAKAREEGFKEGYEARVAEESRQPEMNGGVQRQESQ